MEFATKVKEEEGEDFTEKSQVELQPLPPLEDPPSRVSTPDRYFKFQRGRLDRRFIVWVTQVFVTLLVMFYCFYMLSTQQHSEERTIWISLISAIIGNFMPNGHTSHTNGEGV